MQVLPGKRLHSRSSESFIGFYVSFYNAILQLCFQILQSQLVQLIPRLFSKT